LRYSLSVCESTNNVLRNVKSGQEITSLQQWQRHSSS